MDISLKVKRDADRKLRKEMEQRRKFRTRRKVPVPATAKQETVSDAQDPRVSDPATEPSPGDEPNTETPESGPQDATKSTGSPVEGESGPAAAAETEQVDGTNTSSLSIAGLKKKLARAKKHMRWKKNKKSRESPQV